MNTIDILLIINPLGSKVFLGSLRCFDMPWKFRGVF